MSDRWKVRYSTWTKGQWSAAFDTPAVNRYLTENEDEGQSYRLIGASRSWIVFEFLGWHAFYGVRCFIFCHRMQE